MLFFFYPFPSCRFCLLIAFSNASIPKAGCWLTVFSSAASLVIFSSYRCFCRLLWLFLCLVHVAWFSVALEHQGAHMVCFSYSFSSENQFSNLSALIHRLTHFPLQLLCFHWISFINTHITFMKPMNLALRTLIGVLVVVYFNDILPLVVSLINMWDIDN